MLAVAATAVTLEAFKYLGAGTPESRISRKPHKDRHNP